MVDASRNAVSHGSNVVEAVTGAFESSRQASELSVHNLINVQDAVNQQKSSITAINKLMLEITKVVETNAATAQENAASGSHLMSWRKN